MSLQIHHRVKKEMAAKQAEAAKRKNVDHSGTDVGRLLWMTREAIKDTRDLPTCGYHCKNPEIWKEEFCSNKIWAPHSTYRCYDHAWNDPAVGWPKCSRGKNAVSHKRGIHPGVCPKEPASGLCYFCIKSDEREYARCMNTGETPTLECSMAESPVNLDGDEADSNEYKFMETPHGGRDTPVFGWGDLDDVEEEEEVEEEEVPYQPPALTGEYLAQVYMAVRDLGLTVEGLDMTALNRAYTCIRKDEESDGCRRDQLVWACNFLHGYVTYYC